MKIATFNVNGVNGRLPVLMRWLAETEPDVACLQELKAADEKFPEPAIRKAGYRAVWHGQKGWNGVAILARDRTPMETRRGLPGDPDDAHSRYIEAAVEGVLIGCLYMPNGNPAPGPKFDYKLRWFDRLAGHASELLATGMPVVLAGDFNVMPTNLDVYKPECWVDDALFRPEVREAFHGLLAQGWTDACGRFIRVCASTPSGTTSDMHGRATRVFGSTTCCSARRLLTVSEPRRWTGRSAVGRRRAIMRRIGSS
jgi:exodeoxyribonuclease-3